MMRRSTWRFCAAGATTTTQRPPLRLIECPRDAMQGLKEFVPTDQKIRYINQLLKVGFHTLDCGSFVSAPAVPQMRDTAEVLAGLDMSSTTSKLLVVVCNVKGAQLAVQQEKVTYVGYPLSVSETFQKKNTHRDIATAIDDVKKVHAICQEHKKEMVVYISMGFGNPYGEDFNTQMVIDLMDKVASIGVKIISIADTVGVADTDIIENIYAKAIPRYPEVEVGAHFHSGAVSSADKILQAYNSGCRRFDSALGGMGGCPFAKSTLVGNVSTETMVDVLTSQNITHNLDVAELEKANNIKHDVFGVGVKELLLATVLDSEKYLLDLCLQQFRDADTDDKGYLTQEQFGKGLALAYLQLGEEAPSDEKIARKFKENDLSGDGRITFDEYMVFVRRALRQRYEAQKKAEGVE